MSELTEQNLTCQQAEQEMACLRIIPRGRDELQEGDTVIVVSTRQGMNDLQDIFLPQEAR